MTSERAGGRVIGTAAADAATPAFVGRGPELAALAAALDRGPALVVVEGEPGIGKTRLVHEAVSSVTGRTVLVAECPPLREPFPLGPIVDGVRQLGDRLDRLGRLHQPDRPDRLDQPAEPALSPVCAALRPLFPEWADRLPDGLAALDGAAETRHRLFRALTELVDRLGVEALVLDDAHWADPTTLEWLLTRTTPGDQRMSLVVVYRPAEVPDGSLLRRLTSRAPARMHRVRVELGPLAIPETQRLAGSMFQTGEVSEAFAAFLNQRTDGVPLAVEECVRLLAARDDLVPGKGRWTRRLLEEIEVPPTVRDSVLERVARLRPAARQVLQAAAILAAPADESLLAEVAELPEPAGPEGVSAALASGLLREAGPGRYGFRHVLDAQAVAGAIPAPAARRLHGLAAKALGQRDPGAVERLSRHCREAGDTEGWCGYAEASADLAVQTGDNRNAVTMLHQLLTTIEHPIERRVRLARKLGEAVFFGAAALGTLTDDLAGVLVRVLADVRLAPADRGELRLLIGRLRWRAGQHRAASTAFAAATADLGHRPDLALLVMCNLALPTNPDWPAARHHYWLRRATALVERTDSPFAKVAFPTARATALLLLGEPAGWPAVAELPRAAVGRSERRMLAGGLLNVAWATLVWGRYGDTQQQLQAADEQLQHTADRRLMDAARVARAYLAWYTGAWPDLAGAVSDLAGSEETEPHQRRLVHQLLGLLDLVAGARASAEPVLREVAGEYARLGVADPLAALSAVALGRLALVDDAPEAALRWTTPVVEMASRKGVWLWLTDLAPVHVDGLLATGWAARATAFVAEFADGVDGREAPSAAAAVAAARARLVAATGDQQLAAARFAEAAAAWAAVPRPYDELLAMEGRGRALLAAGAGAAGGEREQGVAVLADAQARLRALGARWDADRVAQLLRRHGVEVARPWRGGRHGYGDRLSPRELEVTRLVAQGLTNKQVAEALFLSRRTVDGQLRNAMRKLQVTSRTSLAVAAAEAGLLAGTE